MAKRKEIASTDQLIDYRKKLTRRAAWWGVFWSLVVVVVYFAYVFLAVAPQGYGAEPAFDWAVDWTFKLPYFDTTIPLTQLSDYTVVLRWVILLVAVIFAVVLGIVVDKLLLSSYKNKAIGAHDKALGNLVKNAYGIRTVYIPGKGYADESDVIEVTNVDEAEKSFTIVLSDQIISFDASQYTYTFDGEECSGVLAVTELVKSKVAGFLQFRTFGTPDTGIVDGKTVDQFNVHEPRLANEFTVYSTLKKPEVDAFITPELASHLIKLRRLVEGGLVVTIQNSTLSVLIDGMTLTVGKGLNQNLQSGFLERQGTAVKALFDIFEGLVQDSTFVADPEVPLVAPLGQQAPVNA